MPRNREPELDWDIGEWMQALAPEELQPRLDNVCSDPPPPDRILRRIRFEDPRSTPAAAEQQGIERGDRERVLDGKTPIAPELVLRMESVWHSRAGGWLDFQTYYDLAQAGRRNAAA